LQWIYNAVLRDACEGKATDNAAKVLDIVKVLTEAGWKRRPWFSVLSDGRSQEGPDERAETRQAGREPLTPSGRALPEQINMTQPFESYADKCSSPPEIRKLTSKGIVAPGLQTVEASRLTNDLAEGAGHSRPIVKALRKAG
jgi:hypothetical protein